MGLRGVLSAMSAIVLASCTFTTADVGPTATSLRSAHEALSNEVAGMDERSSPGDSTVELACRTTPADQLTAAFCVRWADLSQEQRDGLAKELSLRTNLNSALGNLAGYVDALDALVKSREQSEVQAAAIETRLKGLGSAATALAGTPALAPAIAAGFTQVATSLDNYRRTRAAARAAAQAQPALDLFAASVVVMLGECDVDLGKRLEQSTATYIAAHPCSAATRDDYDQAVAGIVGREAAAARSQEYFVFMALRNRVWTDLRNAYEAREKAAGDTVARQRAQAQIDAALQDIATLERARPGYDAAVARQASVEQWGTARRRARHATAEAFVKAADENAALVEAIRRERQLDLGPIGFVLRSLIGV